MPNWPNEKGLIRHQSIALVAPLEIETGATFLLNPHQDFAEYHLVPQKIEGLDREKPLSGETLFDFLERAAVVSLESKREVPTP